MTKSQICPQCKSDKVIPISYGIPTDEEIESEKWGELEFGEGIFEKGISPNRKCLTCGYTWHEKENK